MIQTAIENPFYRQEREFARIHFKLAGTSQTKIYDIPTNLSIANFIEHVRHNAYNDFIIDRTLSIEIVEAGQEIPNVRGEDVPALMPEYNLTVREKYNNRYNQIAFYIRIINNRENYNSHHDIIQRYNITQTRCQSTRQYRNNLI